MEGDTHRFGKQSGPCCIVMRDEVFFVGATCVLARLSCLQLNFLCSRVSSPTVEAEPWAMQVTSLPLSFFGYCLEPS